MSWPFRVPAACKNLDPEAVKLALVESRGNSRAAAARLGVPSSDLRMMILALPELNARVFEEFDRLLDKATAALLAGLEHPRPRERIRAAGALLRMAPGRKATKWRR